MSEYQGTWGLYTWDPSNMEMIHPDERQGATPEKYYGKVFHCIGNTKDQYLILYFAGEQYLVRSNLYQLVSPPQFNFGDVVMDKTLQRQGTILYIWWHFKRTKVYYILLVDNRYSKKWCWEEELELVMKHKGCS